MTANQNIKLTGKHYIAGSWLQGSGPLFVSTNPMDQSPVWQGAIAQQSEVKQAVEAAKKALASWSILAFNDRVTLLQQFANQVATYRQQLAELISLENGKPLWESLTEVTAVVGKINLSIQAYQERNAEKITASAEGNSCLRYKPHGIIAVLGPFNFPAHLSNGHIVPALLAGNTVILKPSELTPAVAELIMHCWHLAGLPAGVINCVQGDSSTGKNLLAEDIQGVYFTGSYQTGKKINQSFADKPEVILALEMGGNNPMIVDEVEDINAAVYQTLLSTLITSGQRCTCARRLFVPDTAKGDQFLEKLVSTFKSLRIGGYTSQPEPFMGPVISHHHALNHLNSQQQLVQQGGKTILGMTLLQENSGLLSPGLIDMSSVTNPDDEEIFAPLVQLYRYHDFEQALDLANKTRYGLSAGLLSDNPNRYEQFYKTIHAGLINWNKPTTGAASNLPFGGVGYSGNHRPSAYFAADYCVYPIASQEQSLLTTPKQLLPGIAMED